MFGKIKKLNFRHQRFFCRKKEIIDVSYPGDIVGLHDTGNFKIGDTLLVEKNFNSKDSEFFTRILSLH